MIDKHEGIVILEENATAGGAGAGVAEYLSNEGYCLPTLILGLPDTNFEQGKREELLSAAGLDEKGIENRIQSWLAKQSKHRGAA